MSDHAKLKRGYKDILDEARAAIREIDATDAVKLADDPEWLIVDVRDARERSRDGYIPNSFHCPRGMVEFWIDPESPYFKPKLGDASKLLFHCALDWRSALTVYTVQRMGVENAFHIKGGLKAWKEANGPVTTEEKG